VLSLLLVSCPKSFCSSGRTHFTSSFNLRTNSSALLIWGGVQYWQPQFALLQDCAYFFRLLWVLWSPGEKNCLTEPEPGCNPLLRFGLQYLYRVTLLRWRVKTQYFFNLNHIPIGIFRKMKIVKSWQFKILKMWCGHVIVAVMKLSLYCLSFDRLLCIKPRWLIDWGQAWESKRIIKCCGLQMYLQWYFINRSSSPPVPTHLSSRTRPSSTRCPSGWRPVRSTCRRWSWRGPAVVRRPLASRLALHGVDYDFMNQYNRFLPWYKCSSKLLVRFLCVTLWVWVKANRKT